MLVALVFVAHPLQTMAASYIVQRAESMAAFFYLRHPAAVCDRLGRRRTAHPTPLLRRRRAHRRARRAEQGDRRHRGRGRVALPVVLPGSGRRGTVNGCARPPSPRCWCCRSSNGLLLAWPYLYDATESFDSAGPRAWLYIPTAGFSVQGVGSWRYLLTELAVIVWYLRLFVLPTPLTFDYGWPFVDSAWRADVLLPLVVLLAIVALAVASYRRYPLATFCIGWVFITLAPTSSIVPLRDAAFEHRMYLPIIGLAWLIVVGGYDLSARLAAWLGQPVAAVRRIGGRRRGAVDRRSRRRHGGAQRGARRAAGPGGGFRRQGAEQLAGALRAGRRAHPAQARGPGDHGVRGIDPARSAAGRAARSARRHVHRAATLRRRGARAHPGDRADGGERRRRRLSSARRRASGARARPIRRPWICSTCSR
jgi:hypothetical protein